MNLVAYLSATADAATPTPSGLGMALRAGIIGGLLIRAYIVAVEPTVQIPSEPPTEGR